MSFTTQVKEDLLHIENEEYGIEYAEVLGVLRFAGEVKLGKNLGISFTCNSKITAYEDKANYAWCQQVVKTTMSCGITTLRQCMKKHDSSHTKATE